MTEYDSTADTLAHIMKVRDQLQHVAAQLLERGRIHDASKLDAEEKPAFDVAIPKLRGLLYGSAQYQAVAAEMGPALAHHYRCNRHHPEHHAAGVAGMDLIDVVEMLCDWIAAASRNPADAVRLDLNVKAFGIEPQLAAILGNTLARLQ